MGFYKIILETIMQRPEMTVGEVSLDRIRLFLNGFTSSYHLYKLYDKEVEHYNMFDDFVQERMGYISTIGWPNIIAEKVSDKEQQFKTFKNLLILHFKNLD